MLKKFGDKILEIEVYDTGIGIKQENMSHLFKMFGRLDDPN